MSQRIRRRAFESDTRQRRWSITKSTPHAPIANDSSELRASAAGAGCCTRSIPASEVILKNAIALTRLRIAQLTGASIPRIAREERRLAIARGMFDGLAG